MPSTVAPEPLSTTWFGLRRGRGRVGPRLGHDLGIDEAGSDRAGKVDSEAAEDPGSDARREAGTRAADSTEVAPDTGSETAGPRTTEPGPRTTEPAPSTSEPGPITPQPGPSTTEPGRRIARRPALRIVAAAVLLIWAGIWLVQRADGGSAARRSPSEAVADFFLARQNGDCAVLVEVVAEDSWSDGGRLDGDDPVERCAAATAATSPADPPRRIGIEILDEDGTQDPEGDEAAVTVDLWADVGVATAPATYGRPSRPTCPLDEDDLGTDQPCGRLVRESGGWRVVLDDVVFRIGRSVPETVDGYLDAYADGDCPRLVGYLSRDAWSAGGERTRRRYVDRCTEAAEARDGREGGEGSGRPTRLQVSNVEVSFDGEDRATALVTFGQGATEEITLAREGFDWQLDGSAVLGEPAVPGTHLHTLRFDELRTLLVDEIQANGSTCFSYLDQPLPGTGGPESASSGLVQAPRPPAGYEVGAGIVRDFSSCYATVSLYELAAEEDPRAAIEAVAERLVGEELPTAADLEETAAETGMATDVDFDAYVAGLRPNHRADVPGVADAVGVASSCDVEGCSEATALAVEGHMVVAVHMEVGDLADAGSVLTAQRERL